MKINLLPILVISAVIAGSCKKEEHTLTQLNGVWKVHSLHGKTVDNMNATCVFDTEIQSISGSSGCNSYGANITVNAKDHSLLIGNITQTKIGCPGEKGIFEVDFFDALRKVRHYHFDRNNVLELTDDSNGTIELQK